MKKDKYNCYTPSFYFLYEINKIDPQHFDL